MFFNDELQVADLGRKDGRIIKSILSSGVDLDSDENLASLSRKGFGKESVFRAVSKIPEENDLF
ncbi:MAG: hypothetical protein HY512_00560 [Candidatus Aenigmarchaeota archaeon]|nr:hypothetical protein [Candidatus Aenigmarchaeota archaeon]